MDYRNLLDRAIDSFYDFLRRTSPESFSRQVRKSSIYRNLEEKAKIEKLQNFEQGLRIRRLEYSLQEYKQELDNLRDFSLNFFKENSGLRRLVEHQKARIYRDKKVSSTFNTFLKLPRIKKIPLLIVHNSGKVYAQSPIARKRYGNFIGRNIGDVLDCSKPHKETSKIDGRFFVCYVCPLKGEDEVYDYSAVYLTPEPKINRMTKSVVKKGDEEMNRLFDKIIKDMKNLELRVDSKLKPQTI